MSAVLELVFRSFWTWAGTVILVGVLGDAVRDFARGFAGGVRDSAAKARGEGQ